MKYTLLELVQTIASSLDSDEINSITDSVESEQITKIVKTVYFDIIGRANLPEHYSLKNLQASGNSSKPVLMYVPSDVEEIKWIKYNNATIANPEIDMVTVQYQNLNTFLDRMDGLLSTDSNIGSFTHTVGSDVFTILYRNDVAPQHYTTFDDNTLVFDSYDSSVDTTLQSSKSRAYCKLVIPWTDSDTFTPDLDEEQFPLLLNEAKSLAWTELKQSAHPKAEQNARRGWTHLNKHKYSAETLSDFDKLPNFGRNK